MARTIQQTLTTGAAGGLEEPIKKHKPKDTRLRQQRLPAWQPILDAKTVIPVFITISLLFIPVGIVLIITSNSVVIVWNSPPLFFPYPDHFELSFVYI
uniref:Uncharacterized protein n=1 Tax=Meloidogyne incognita TaxID=6306 RepID=A0A914MZ91_MELIC